MRRVSGHRFITLWLGLWIALAPAFAAFPAAAMTLEMSQPVGTAADCCDTCPQEKFTCELCAMMCRLAAQTATAAAGGCAAAVTNGQESATLRLALAGLDPPPDPAPPKHVPLA